MKKIASSPALVKSLLGAAAGALAVLAAGMPATAQAPELAMLSGLDRGNWDVRFRSGERRQICVRNGRELIQVMHPVRACQQTIVSDGSASVVVQYSCNGAGYGHMTIRKETSSLVQISGNGTQGKKPFTIAAEARHTGRCAR